MEPMTIALIASGILGLNKSQEQQRAYKEQMKTEAVKERWAPFTGRRGQSGARPSATDPIMQALVTGAMMGQQFKGGPAPTDAQANAAAGNAGGSAELGTMPQPAPARTNVNPAFGQQGYFDPYNPG